MQDAGAMAAMLAKAGRFDWVIHNAGVTKALRQEDYYTVNEGNTRRFVEALQQADAVPERFLYISSLAALGAPPPGAIRIAADQPPRPLTAYGHSKWRAEQYLESLGASFPWVVAQPTAVYGPWERDILTVIRLVNRGLELSIGPRDQRLSFIHGHDVARSVFALLEHADVLRKKFIIADGKDYRAADVGASIREALGRKATIKIRIPAAVMRPVATLSELSGRWRGKAVPLNREQLAQLTAPNWHCDAEPLLTTIGFEPAFDLYTGMKDAVEWYRKAGWI
jgi:nucleoside-diphosphate-sugar epimerase